MTKLLFVAPLEDTEVTLETSTQFALLFSNTLFRDSFFFTLTHPTLTMAREGTARGHQNANSICTPLKY
jgi:hypothetical protein